MKRKIYIAALLLFVLVGIQTVTYFTIGLPQLENKLLADDFQFAHSLDSAFVSDHQEVYCATGLPIYIKHDLVAHESQIKEKLKVTHVEFHTQDDSTHHELRNHKLSYTATSFREDQIPVFNFYSACQNEIMITESFRYEKTVRYQWVLFFWVERVVYFQSSDLPISQIVRTKN